MRLLKPAGDSQAACFFPQTASRVHPGMGHWPEFWRDRAQTALVKSWMVDGWGLRPGREGLECQAEKLDFILQAVGNKEKLEEGQVVFKPVFCGGYSEHGMWNRLGGLEKQGGHLA